MADFREVVYRLRLRDEKRSPSLVASIVPDGSLQTETLATNLDEKGNVWRLVQVRGRPSELAQVDKAFTRPIPSVVDQRVLARGRSHRVLWYKYTRSRGGAGPSLTELALRLLGPEAIVSDRTVGGELEVRVLSRPGPALTRYLRELPGTAAVQHHFTLLHVGPPRSTPGPALTAVEEQAVLAAHKAGFLGVPRQGSARSLGRQLGCSPSAFSARLRRGLGKLADVYAGG